MGNPIGPLLKDALGANLPQIIRSFADYSYVLKARDTHLREGANPVAEFELSAGSWILLAKSTVRGQGSDGSLDMQLTLSATENAAMRLDRAKASVVHFEYSTVSLLLGTTFVTAGKVKLEAALQGIERSAELVDTVIAAVKMDKLLVWDL